MLRLLACVLITDDAHDERVDADGDGAIAAAYGGDDCDDGNPAITPAASEICDGLDNDCDGAVDDGEAAGAAAWYVDEDGDGFGADATMLACELPAGHAATSGDCDDARADVHPGADEACTPDDRDCDGIAGDDDGDGDGFAACDDCDPRNTNVHPDAAETCNDVDDDCDGAIDEDGGATWYADEDGDGYGSDAAVACDQPAGHVEDDGDCDDADALTYPGAEEDCSLGIDRDCDGSTGLEDSDADGIRACEDCDDANAAIFPEATELCNGVDDNCDGVVDDDATDRSLFYADLDGDGFGDASSPTLACEVPEFYVADSSDCDDADAGVTDGEDWYADGDGDGYGVTGTGARVCTGATTLDGDCDDADAALNPGTVWYADADDDGFGDAGETWTACVGPSGYLLDGTDCDDADEAVFPGATEGVGDEVDSDCDGGEICFADGDLDGWAGTDTVVSGDVGCDAVGEGIGTDDCDDADDSIFPTAMEGTGDGIDQDCDGGESCWLDSDGDGHGVGTAVASADVSCAGAGESTSDTDCDDGDATISPGVGDTPADGVDNDCDGMETCFADTDGDGYGDSATVESADMDCADAGESADDGDCDEGDSTVHPGATEVCEDGIDQDCQEGAEGCGIWRTATGASADAYVYCSGYKQCGASVGAGDIDGDGEIDLAFGFPMADFSSVTDTSGFGWVPGPFSGKIDFGGSGVAGQGYWESDRGENLGESIAVIGDVTGDGDPDILVGDNQYGGRALVMESGSTPGDSSDADELAHAYLSDDADFTSQFGNDVAPHHDEDGDGVDEYLVAAQYATYSSGYDGVVYVMDGMTTGSSTPADAAIGRVYGSPSDKYTGIAVERLDDVDGDGLDDAFVSSEATAAIFTSALTGDLPITSGDAVFASLGCQCRAAGGVDFDGDGLGDVALAAQNADVTSTDAGAVYAVTDVMTATTDLSGEAVVVGASSYDFFGTRVAAGDFNGDGTPDLAGQRGNDNNPVYVVPGPFAGSQTTDDAQGAWTTDRKYDGSSTSVTALETAGDTDGDGTDDLLVGCSSYSPSSSAWEAGTIYLILGSYE